MAGNLEEDPFKTGGIYEESFYDGGRCAHFGFSMGIGLLVLRKCSLVRQCNIPPANRSVHPIVEDLLKLGSTLVKSFDFKCDPILSIFTEMLDQDLLPGEVLKLYKESCGDARHLFLNDLWSYVKRELEGNTELITVFRENYSTGCEESIYEVPDRKSQGAKNQVTPRTSAMILGFGDNLHKAIVDSVVASGQYSKICVICDNMDGFRLPCNVEQKVVDFDNIEKHAAEFKDLDVGFCALGTTRGTAGKEGQYKADCNYVVNSAKVAKEQGMKDWVMVMAATWNDKSSFSYAKSKENAENECVSMGFEKIIIGRPGFHQRFVSESRFVDALGRFLSKPMGFFSNKDVVADEDVAKALVVASVSTDRRVLFLNHTDLTKQAKGFASIQRNHDHGVPLAPAPILANTEKMERVIESLEFIDNGEDLPMDVGRETDDKTQTQKCSGADKKGGGGPKAPGNQAAKAGTHDPNYQTLAGTQATTGTGGAPAAGAGADKLASKGGEAPKPAAGGPKAPTEGGVAGTHDPNYRTLAGVGGECFGADKQTKGAPAAGGGPKAPAAGGMAGTHDPNYQTLAGVGGDCFDKKGPAGGGGPKTGAGGVAATHDPNYQTLAGIGGNECFGADNEKKGAGAGPKTPGNQAAKAGTHDPNYQTLAGIGGNECSGADKKDGGGPKAAKESGGEEGSGGNERKVMKK